MHHDYAHPARQLTQTPQLRASLKESGFNGELALEIYTTHNETRRPMGNCCITQEPSRCPVMPLSVGWEGGPRGRGYSLVCIYVVGRQKSIQCHKTIIQLKNKIFHKNLKNYKELGVCSLLEPRLISQKFSKLIIKAEFFKIERKAVRRQNHNLFEDKSQARQDSELL